MSDPLQLTLWFGLGVIVQAIFLIYDRLNSKNLRNFFLCLLFSVIFGFIPRKGEGIVNYDVVFHIFIWFIFFLISFAAVFRKEILPEINKTVILSFTLIFWYIFLVYFYSNTIYKNFLTLIVLIPTIATLISVFTNLKLSFFWRLFFYVWFLILLISLLLSQLSLETFSSFFKKDGIVSLTFIDALVTGMVFLYLCVNSLYVINVFFTYKDEEAPPGERLKAWREHIRMLVDKYIDYQPHPILSLLIILLLGGIFAANYYNKFISDFLLINILILIVPFLSYSQHIKSENL